MQHFDAGNGIAAESLSFYYATRPELGEITEATIRFPGFTDPYDPYLMMLRDTAGNEILLSGCTTGYLGEGPRAAMEVLLDAGFSAEDASRVLTDPQLQLARRQRPASVRADDTPMREQLRAVAGPDSGRLR